jgi:hypothetical protein
VSFAAAACAAVLLACGPGQVSLAKGTLLAFRPTVDGPLRVIDLHDGKTRWRLPPGVLGGHLLVHRDGSLLTWFDAATGARAGDAVLQAHGSFALVGASQDGREAVLARTEKLSTTFAIVSPAGERDVSRPGHWRFVALARSQLTAVPASRPLPGVPLQQVDSSGGRYRFTLFRGGTGAAVQIVDTRTSRTRAIALPGPADAEALLPDPSERDLWAVNGATGRYVLIDAVAGRVVSRFRYAAGRFAGLAPQLALAPDGEHIAVSEGGRVIILTPATGAVLRLRPHVAIALGWSPDERTLWVLGERSRFSPLHPRVVR